MIILPIMLYSMGMFLLGYEFGKAKYKYILKEVEKKIDECFNKEDDAYLLEKKLDIAVKALQYYAQCKHINLDLMTIREGCAEFEAFEDGEHARQALKEMKG